MLKDSKSPLDVFYDVAESLDNPYIRAWKEKGGKVVGYYYEGVPEELLTAAGIMPFRLRATTATGTEFSDAYVATINCVYVRYHLDLAIRGEYSFLDGVVGYNACDHIRRAYDNWSRLIDKDGRWFHFVTVPQKQGPEQTEWYAVHLGRLKTAIEEGFGVTITDEKLRDAIALHNDIRALQRKLFGLRLCTSPKLSGSDAMAAIVAGFSMPKADYKKLLVEYIAELVGSKGIPAEKRLMLLGGELDDPCLLQIIEEQGACIVTDMIWDGNRSIIRDVPLKATRSTIWPTTVSISASRPPNSRDITRKV
jgi:benzoyl-CoA reductase/2-hydroxyglutaryl-CoA dehydratase subunit BcrC/BadD/HgdB